MYMKDLNSSQFKELQTNNDTVILPIGMVEAHGPHSSLATDILIPREFIRRLEPVIGSKVLVAPEISYGHSWENAPFPGTINISSEVFGKYVSEVAKEFYRHGFKNIILFNGHGGNRNALKVVTEDLAQLGATVLTVDWWVDYRDEIMKITKSPGHAGEDETSLVLAIDKNLADVSLVGHHEVTLPRKLVYKNWSKDAFPDAYFGDAGSATAEKGERIYDALLPIIISEIELLWNH